MFSNNRKENGPWSIVIKCLSWKQESEVKEKKSFGTEPISNHSRSSKANNTGDSEILYLQNTN